ncbi:MAG: DUF4129 domain-containing transglutaminase family protein [Fimbriimonas sp.]
MILGRVFRNRSDIGSLDYLLTMLGAMLAVFSVGMAIGQEVIGFFLMGVVLVGTACSFLMRRALDKSKWLNLDGYFYAILVIASIAGTNALNSILPGEGFPLALRTASVLCWMLALGSFGTWRDGTLLFQAIPSIAIFGLVGCYDTFRNVTFTFFGFLICLATLFARAHSRDMLQQASASGYFGQEAARLNRPPVEESSEMFEQIRIGPWRWIAGPEWALASALAIILVSLVGAPVIQESVRGVSGFVPSPSLPVRPPPPPSVVSTDAEGTSRIGQGPNQLRDTILYEARMDQARYLRAAAFDSYTGRGWNSVFSRGLSAADVNDPKYVDVSLASIEAIEDSIEIEFAIKAVLPTKIVPVPGELLEIEKRDEIIQKPDGTYEASGSTNVRIAGRSVVARTLDGISGRKKDLPASLRRTLSVDKIPARVKSFATEAARDGKTDYEKAILLKQAISAAAKYNLNAAPTPVGQDPVEYFLFTQKEGYCDLYASSMVLGARVLGIPARYVTGFLPDAIASTSASDEYKVREKDAHAWAELFFEGVGWVIFDATDGAEAVGDAGRGGTNIAVPWYRLLWVQILGGLFVIGGVGFVGYLAMQARKALTPAVVLRRRLDKVYLQFQANLQQAAGGQRRQMGQTADEYLGAVAGALGPTLESAKLLNQQFVAAFYSPSQPSEAEIETLRRQVASFGRELQREKKRK